MQKTSGEIKIMSTYWWLLRLNKISVESAFWPFCENLIEFDFSAVPQDFLYFFPSTKVIIDKSLWEEKWFYCTRALFLCTNVYFFLLNLQNLCLNFPTQSKRIRFLFAIREIQYTCTQKIHVVSFLCQLIFFLCLTCGQV